MPSDLEKTTSDDLESFRRRFPAKTDKELLEIKQFVRRYLEIALDIFDEIQSAKDFDSPLDKT